MAAYSRPGSLLVVLLWVLLGCDGGTRVEGRVRDRSGTYLPAVLVTLTVGERNRGARTDGDGRYRISMMHSPFDVEERLRFEKSGYLEHQIHFMSHDGLQELDVTLQPQSEQTPLH